MKKIVVIPARLNSTRLPHKVLLDLEGKSVVQRVYEQCLKAKSIDDVYIATDSRKICDVCAKFTDNVIMTKETHQSGTDRVAEVVEKIGCDVVINVQGDEPFIEPELINNLSNAFTNDISMVSAMHRISKVDDLKSHNIVKVTIDKHNNALYFSRSIIPHHRDDWETLLNHHDSIPHTLRFYRHLGVYGYTKEFLLKYANMKQTYLEKVEKLEQLRALENGYKIKMVETTYNSIGIDTQEDYERAIETLKKGSQNG